MMNRLRTGLLAACALITGCATDPNAHWFENAMMSHEVLEVGPRQYKLTTYGAGAHKRDQVERGFLTRAGQICEGKPFTHDLVVSPYEYSSAGGGYSFRHSAFKGVGIVKCE